MTMIGGSCKRKRKWVKPSILLSVSLLATFGSIFLATEVYHPSSVQMRCSYSYYFAPRLLWGLRGGDYFCVLFFFARSLQLARPFPVGANLGAFPLSRLIKKSLLFIDPRSPSHETPSNKKAGDREDRPCGIRACVSCPPAHISAVQSVWFLSE